MPGPPQGLTDSAERKIPRAACDSGIPATECLAWHVSGRVPDARMSGSGMSCRLRCPNHPDDNPSLVISVGEYAPLTWYCHVCGKEARLEVRTGLIREYHLDPRCLPMARQDRAEMEDLMIGVLESVYTPCTKLICMRALLEGMRGPLPPAPALVELGARAGVSRRQAFRARDELGGASLDHLFVSAARRVSQAPQATPAIRGSTSVPNWHSVPNGHSGQCQSGTEIAPTVSVEPANQDKPIKPAA